MLEQSGDPAVFSEVAVVGGGDFGEAGHGHDVAADHGLLVAVGFGVVVGNAEFFLCEERDSRHVGLLSNVDIAVHLSPLLGPGGRLNLSCSPGRRIFGTNGNPFRRLRLRG